MRHHPNRSVRLPVCQPRVHPRGQASPDLSPEALSPRHPRPRLLPTVQAFGPLAWRLRRAVPPPFSLGVPHEPRRRRAYDALGGRLRGGQGGVLRPPSWPGHPADRPRSVARPSGHRRRIDPARPSCGWRTLGWRAHSSRASHTSSPVRVPRPAPAFHASFKPHLAVTPWRFPGPSAPRIPGRGTFTPKHDHMPGTHA